MRALSSRREPLGAAPSSQDAGRFDIFGRTLRIGSVRGIDIKVDASWIIIALLVVWTFWARFGQRFDMGAAIAMAVAATLLFFASVLVHELAHSLEAQHRGVDVGGITLFLFGGVTETRFDVRRPRDEFALTAVGPFSSFVLAAAFGLLATYADAVGFAVVAEVSGLLGWINLALAVFNLLPGAPLDGGRILRSAVWAATKDRAKAVRVAGRAGQVLGGLLTASGLFLIFFVPAAIGDGVWLAIIGWFLAGTAGAELAQAELEAAVGRRPIERFVTELPHPVTEHESVADAEERLTRSGQDVVPVSRNGEVIGMLSDDVVASVPSSERSRTTVSTVVRSLANVPDVGPDEGVMDVIHRLRKDEFLAVRDDAGQLLGILSREQLDRAVRRARTLDRSGRRRRRRRSGHLPGEGG